MVSRDELRARIEKARELARENVAVFATAIDRDYTPSKVHLLLCRVWQRIAEGKGKRYIINMPPRHGKTEICGIKGPLWMMGRMPGLEVVYASHGQDFSNRTSGFARDVAAYSEAYRKIFNGLTLQAKRAHISEWTITNGSSYRAVGVGGSLTGRGADLLVLDDLFKDFEEAHSETIRQKVWDWFGSTAYTRLSPNGIIVIIMTRWHVGDLVGQLIDPAFAARLEDSGLKDEQWEVINLPAIAEDGDLLGRAPGEALWPERWPVERLRGIQEVIGSYKWSAMYRGSPQIQGGNYIKTGNFKIIAPSELDPLLRWHRSWDLATSSDSRADYTAGIKCAIDREGNIFFADLQYGKWEWPEARARIKQIALIEEIPVGIEAVGGFKTAFQNLNEYLAGKIVLREFNVDQDKFVRALPLIAKVEARKAYLVNGPWIPAFIQQAGEFPSGVNDDFIDAAVGAMKMAETVAPPFKQLAVPNKHVMAIRERRKRALD